MGEPSEEELDRAVTALVPFVQQWDISLNPEDLRLMAYVVLLYGPSAEPHEAIVKGVEEQLAWVKDKRSQMYEAWIGERIDPPHPWRKPT
jgi:hypothetical protein